VIFLFSFVRPKEVFDFAENVPDRARVLLRYAQERPRRIPGVNFINILPAALVANKFTLIVLGSISTTFYEQLLRIQIPKAQKNRVKPSVFFAFLGSAQVKAARKMFMKSNPCAKYRVFSVKVWCNF
jgi:hypothetical protein